MGTFVIPELHRSSRCPAGTQRNWMRLVVRPVPFAADSVRRASRSVLSINHGAVRWNDCWWRNTSAARGRRTAVEFNEILSRPEY